MEKRHHPKSVIAINTATWPDETLDQGLKTYLSTTLEQYGSEALHRRSYQGCITWEPESILRDRSHVYSEAKARGADIIIDLNWREPPAYNASGIDDYTDVPGIIDWTIGYDPRNEQVDRAMNAFRRTPMWRDRLLPGRIRFGASEPQPTTPLLVEMQAVAARATLEIAGLNLSRWASPYLAPRLVAEHLYRQCLFPNPRENG